MPVPTKRHSKGRRDRGRTHKKLTGRQMARCESCGAPRLPHRVCRECGQYRGRVYRVTVTS